MRVAFDISALVCIKKCVRLFSFCNICRQSKSTVPRAKEEARFLRTSLTLGAIFSKPIRITRIRVGRREPGLRPQHLQSVLATTRICEGKVRGATVGSTEIEFLPGRLPKKFNGLLDTGTAGSISLIAQTIIPISIFGGTELDVEIRGGTEVPNAPTIDYLIRLMIPVYRNLGAEVDLNLKKRGYYPKGGGSVILRTSKNEISKPIEFVSDQVAKSSILSVSRQLPEHVAKRQAESAQQLLLKNGIDVSNAELDLARRFSFARFFNSNLSTQFIELYRSHFSRNEGEESGISRRRGSRIFCERAQLQTQRRFASRRYAGHAIELRSRQEPVQNFSSHKSLPHQL